MKSFVNKLRFVLHAYKIFFSEIVCYAMIGKNKQAWNSVWLGSLSGLVFLAAVRVAFRVRGDTARGDAKAKRGAELRSATCASP